MIILTEKTCCSSSYVCSLFLFSCRLFEKWVSRQASFWVGFNKLKKGFCFSINYGLLSFCLSVIFVLCISSHGSGAYAQGGCGNITVTTNQGVLTLPKQELSDQLGLDLCTAADTFTAPALISSGLMALSFKELVEFYMIISIAYQRLTPEQKANKLYVAGLVGVGVASFLGAGFAMGGAFYGLTGGLIDVPAGQAKTVRRITEFLTYGLGVRMCWRVAKSWQQARTDFLAGEMPVCEPSTSSSYGAILADVALNAGREGLELGALAGVQLAPLASADYMFRDALINSVLVSVFAGFGVATIVPLIIVTVDQVISRCGSKASKARWGWVKAKFKKYQVAIIGVQFLMCALGFSMSHEFGELLGVESYVLRLHEVANYFSAVWPVRANMTFWDAVVFPIMQVVLIIKTFQIVADGVKHGDEYDQKIQELEDGEPTIEMPTNINSVHPISREGNAGSYPNPAYASD